MSINTSGFQMREMPQVQGVPVDSWRTPEPTPLDFSGIAQIRQAYEAPQSAPIRQRLLELSAENAQNVNALNRRRLLEPVTGAPSTTLVKTAEPLTAEQAAPISEDDPEASRQISALMDDHPDWSNEQATNYWRSINNAPPAQAYGLSRVTTAPNLEGGAPVVTTEALKTSDQLAADQLKAQADADRANKGQWTKEVVMGPDKQPHTMLINYTTGEQKTLEEVNATVQSQNDLRTAQEDKIKNAAEKGGVSKDALVYWSQQFGFDPTSGAIQNLMIGARNLGFSVPAYALLQDSPNDSEIQAYLLAKRKSKMSADVEFQDADMKKEAAAIEAKAATMQSQFHAAMSSKAAAAQAAPTAAPATPEPAGQPPAEAAAAAPFNGQAFTPPDYSANAGAAPAHPRLFAAPSPAAAAAPAAASDRFAKAPNGQMVTTTPLTVQQAAQLPSGSYFFSPDGRMRGPTASP